MIEAMTKGQEPGDGEGGKCSLFIVPLFLQTSTHSTQFGSSLGDTLSIPAKPGHNLVR